MDFGAAVGSAAGIPPEQVRALRNWRSSDVFDDRERLVLALAEGMTATPAHVPEDVFRGLRERFSEAQLVELVASVAIENYTARFNRAFGIDAQGFAGSGCPLP